MPRAAGSQRSVRRLSLKGVWSSPGLALEAAHAIPALYGRTHFDAQLDERYALLNWAPSMLLQASPPLPAERWWWLAAIASIQGQADTSYSIPRGEALLQLASVRFPDEQRFTLQRGLLEDQHINPPLITFPDASPGLSSRGLGVAVVEDASGRADIASIGSTPAASSFSPGDIRHHIREAIRAFSSLLDNGALAPEAQLHLGSVELRLNALDLCSRSPGRGQSRPSSLIHGRPLRRIPASGRYARSRLHQGDRAEAALREAAALVPGTDSEVRTLAWR